MLFSPSNDKIVPIKYLGGSQVSQTFSNSEISEILVKYMPAEIKDYFFKSYPEMAYAYQSAIGSWFFSNDQTKLEQLPDLTLNNIIYYILDKELASQPAEEVRAKVLLQKKNRKSYLFRLIRQQTGEIDTLSPIKRNYVEEEWEVLNNPYLKDNEQLSFNWQSKEEFLAKRCKQVADWYKDDDSYLFDFLYFNALSSDKRAKDILTEIQFAVISTICNDFYRNVQGVLTKSPDITFGTDSKIVNWQSSSMSLSYEAKDNKITVYEELGYNPENSVKLIIDEIPCDTNNADIVQALELQLEKEYSAGTRTRTFDFMDYNIYSATLNNMTLESATTKPIEISLFNMATDVYGLAFHKLPRQNRHRKYVELLSRLIKMANMKINKTVLNNAGNSTSGYVISFFDIKYTVPTLPETKELTILDTSGRAQPPDFSKLSIKDFESVKLTIMPSMFMKDQWMNVTHLVLESREYHQITSQRGKILLQMLQSDRLEKYPHLESQISYSTVRGQIRFSSYNDSAFKRELGKELDALKESGALIQSYKLVRSSIQIVYKPLSNIEKKAFRIPQEEA